MLFNSYIFILLFLPLCLIGYFTLNYFKKYKLGLVFLLIMSLWFYGYFNYSYLLVMISSICVNFLIFKFLNKPKKSWKKILLVIGLIFNIGMLFYFKYFDFFIENLNTLFKTNFNLKNIILPLGISFFTFQQISFLVDIYRGEGYSKYTFIEYATFVTFFPQLIAGPIVTHDELIPQFKNEKKKKFDWENFSKGIYIFTLGLAKKVLIADVFGAAVNYGFSNISNLNSTNAIIVMLSYTFQLYFDFSGYSDMAIGLGKMLNIDLPINFNSPYKALTIVDFWKRWNITITRFFTKYIYIPLGGSQKGRFRTAINIMVVFFVSGLWHGANWTFIVWGLLHGIFYIITKHFRKWFKNLHPALSWIITFIFVNMVWIIFRADNLGEACIILKKIILLDTGNISTSIIDCFSSEAITWILNAINPIILETLPKLFLLLYFSFTIFTILYSNNSCEKMKNFKPSYKNSIFIVFLLIWSVLSFSKLSTFLYFNF